MSAFRRISLGPTLVIVIAAAAVVCLASANAFAQSGLSFDPINTIPTPAPITIRPRVVTAYGTLIAAAMLAVLYLYRSRPFILFWIGSFLLLATALGITSVISESAPGSLVNGGALLSLALSAGLLRVAADAYPRNGVHWRDILAAATAISAWFVLGPTFVPMRGFISIGLLLTAMLLVSAALRYFAVARQGRQFGALVIAVGLAVVAAGIGVGVIAETSAAPDPVFVSRIGALNVVTSLFVTLGMVLLVFEELTDELRRTNYDLAAANDAARRLAITDALTGCHNRRFFEEIERREINRHRRYGVPLSVVFIDVNRLKQLNDSLGHEQGDEALRAIGAMLRREVRQSDYVFRWGGDEFLLLLTCSLTVARAKGLGFKETFQRDHETAALAQHIGLSVGVAAVASDADSLQDAIREADVLMYRDKLGEGTPLRVR